VVERVTGTLQSRRWVRLVGVAVAVEARYGTNGGDDVERKTSGGRRRRGRAWSVVNLDVGMPLVEVVLKESESVDGDNKMLERSGKRKRPEWGSGGSTAQINVVVVDTREGKGEEGVYVCW
jgi:hypothetical protein